jgi:hypothetical protein
MRATATFFRDVPIIARSRVLEELSDLIRWSLQKLREARCISHMRERIDRLRQEELLSGDRDLDVYAVRYLRLFQVRRAGRVERAGSFWPTSFKSGLQSSTSVS